MQTPIFLMAMFKKLIIFELLENAKTSRKTNIILTFFLLQKIHLENSIFFLSHVCGENLPHAKTCRTSAVVLTKIKIASNSRLFIIREVRRGLVRRLFFFLGKKSACSPGAVNEINKTYSTSAVPLLVRNLQYVCGAVARNLWNISKTQLKNIDFPR